VDAGAAAQFRKEMGIDAKSFLAGTVCFMRSWKGIEVFLQAADFLRSYENFKWVLIGGGHIEKYRQLAASMRLDNIVYFTGHLENPFPALSSLDAFLLLSTANEGVSQAILQAAFLKKPLIATPTGGLSEVCVDGVSGMQVPIFQPRAVADAIVALQNNPALADRLGTNAKELVLEQFTFQQTLDGMEEVYHYVVSRNCSSD
jgi:glycosyltransferase involved in cell wall biosynthesis